MTDLKDIKPTATATQAGAKRYNDFGTWLRSRFPFKVQKIAVDAGFTCPNRDRTLSSGGCTFCDNTTFNPKYCSPRKSITEQLEEGKDFFLPSEDRASFLLIDRILRDNVPSSSAVKRPDGPPLSGASQAGADRTGAPKGMTASYTVPRRARAVDGPEKNAAVPGSPLWNSIAHLS